MTGAPHPTALEVRLARGPKVAVDPLRPIGHSWEKERTADGRVVPVLAVFIAGAECPMSCVFCDLWRFTLDGPTPRGAVPAQLDRALRSAGPAPRPAVIKLYNASNFFDPRAVPPEDDAAVAGRLGAFSRVTVECHPRFLDRRAVEFAERLQGRLEVAIGLETVHPEALGRLRKGLDLEDFDRAAAFLQEAGIAVRAFVLVPPPFVSPDESVPSVVATVEYAASRGVGQVSLIPTRADTRAMRALRERGDFVPPRLEWLEDALERTIGLPQVAVAVDMWDIQGVASCPDCGPRRVERLRRMNLGGVIEPRERCAACGRG